MNICYQIAIRALKRQFILADPAVISNRYSYENYWKWQHESSSAYFKKIFDFPKTLFGKRILDIGCGIGGRTCYLTAFDPKEIVAIDINHQEIEIARKLASEHLSKEHAALIKFVKIRENEKLELGLFDIVLLIDSLEHVKDPLAMLNYAFDLTAPRGICYFITVGWYHHEASHINSIIPIPFVTFFFTDRQIIEAIIKIVDSPYYKPSIWDSDPPSRRWLGISDLS